MPTINGDDSGFPPHALPAILPAFEQVPSIPSMVEGSESAAKVAIEAGPAMGQSSTTLVVIVDDDAISSRQAGLSIEASPTEPALDDGSAPTKETADVVLQTSQEEVDPALAFVDENSNGRTCLAAAAAPRWSGEGF
jgi:hypothetical protein